jgi:hypothetical protein
VKINKSKIMRKLLKDGLKEAKKIESPSDGYIIPLFTKQLNNGWYYQIDFINDTRVYEKPCVAVFGFKPPLRWDADFYLYQEVKQCKK